MQVRARQRADRDMDMDDDDVPAELVTGGAATKRRRQHEDMDEDDDDGFYAQAAAAAQHKKAARKDKCALHLPCHALQRAPCSPIMLLSAFVVVGSDLESPERRFVYWTLRRWLSNGSPGGATLHIGCCVVFWLPEVH